MVRDDKTNPHVFKILNSVISIRPGNSRHDTTTRNEHDTNTNLTRYEKITKTRQKTRHGQKNEHDTETQIS